MIKSFEVINLNEKITTTIYFHEDLNIFTGKNGSGKTTLLKLMWYIVSGNSDKIFEEMSFEYAKVTMTDNAYIEIKTFIEDDIKQLKYSVKSEAKNVDYHTQVPLSNYDKIAMYQTTEGSLFFPTFRRIEGGFTITSNLTNRTRIKRNTLRDALESISESLTTTTNHKFIASISTEDINYLLSNKYSDISEEIRKLEANQSKLILDIVANSEDKEKESLEEIRDIVRTIDTKRNDVLKPISVLSGFVTNIFKDKSIKISNNFELGEAKEAIMSEKLSAGEKQMLSFLCYNFFYDDSIIFIDEPELSLHTDWQRILFPTLLRQEKKNQFIIATHSPFIYAKYTDKEIIINQDKGNDYAK